MMHHHAKFDSEKFIRSEDMEGSFLENLKHSLKKMDYASTDFDVKWLSKALLHISLFSFFLLYIVLVIVKAWSFCLFVRSLNELYIISVQTGKKSAGKQPL